MFEFFGHTNMFITFLQLVRPSDHGSPQPARQACSPPPCRDRPASPASLCRCR
jgi:hypothetical protein